jgi:hypothetical protein
MEKWFDVVKAKFRDITLHLFKNFGSGNGDGDNRNNTTNNAMNTAIIQIQKDTEFVKQEIEKCNYLIQLHGQLNDLFVDSFSKVGLQVKDSPEIYGRFLHNNEEIERYTNLRDELIEKL